MHIEKTDLSALIARARAGDTRAFDCLVLRFQDAVVGYARAQLRGDPAGGEDAAQEAFVQAWRNLPSLREPAAFPSWLRRIVFKYCDRVRRGASPERRVGLDAARSISAGPDPESAALRADDAARVRAAVDALPDRQRETILLYYLGDQSVTSIAEFLDVPASTVKNRLHAARKRLRKELSDMSEAVAPQILQQQRPSRDDAFAGRVLYRVVRAFREQMAADPHTADRGLLAEGRRDLDARLDEPGPLDEATVRAGYYLLSRQQDLKARAALLMRYLAQPLDDSSAAWAYLHLANTLSCSEDPAGAAIAYEAFERWLPGRPARLSADWPYYPLAGEPTAERGYGGEELRLRVLANSGEFADAWNKTGRTDAYLDRLEATLSRLTATVDNRYLRFVALRMACYLCERASRFEAGERFVARIYALAGEPDETDDHRACWQAKALGHDVSMRVARGDASGVAEFRDRAEALLRTSDASWAPGERHDLANSFVRSGEYDRALTLLDRNLSGGGHVNAWGYALHGIAAWAASGDRPRTLVLLRNAAVREGRDLKPLVLDRPEFAGVRDDPEFLEALRTPD